MDFSLLQRDDRSGKVVRLVVIEDHEVTWVRMPDGGHRLTCACDGRASHPNPCKHKQAAKALRACELRQEYGIEIVGEVARTPERLTEVVLDMARRAAEGEWVGQVDCDLDLPLIASVIDVPPDSVWRYVQQAIDSGKLLVERNVVKVC